MDKKHLTSTQTNTYSRKMITSLDRFSLVLTDAKHKKILFKVIKLYFVIAIGTTVGKKEKLIAVHEIFANLRYYNRFHHKLGLFTGLLKERMRRVIK